MLHNSYCVDDYDDVNLFTSMMMMTTIIILFMLIRSHLGSRQRLTLCCVPSGYQGNLCLEPELRCAVWLSGGLRRTLSFPFRVTLLLALAMADEIIAYVEYTWRGPWRILSALTLAFGRSQSTVVGCCRIIQEIEMPEEGSVCI